jgi:V/A-type H+/Na+-transporting ATPase subunit E
MTLPGVAALRESVMKEAERASRRTLDGANAQAERIRAEAEAEVDRECAGSLDTAGVAVARYRQQVVGSAVLEARSLRARRREVVLDRVLLLASGQLASPSTLSEVNYSAVVEGLVREAVAQLSEVNALVIRGDPAALAILSAGPDESEPLMARIGEATGHHLSLGEPLAQGVGVIVASPDGRLSYDNTLQTRMDRMRDVLRAEIAKIIATGVE